MDRELIKHISHTETLRTRIDESSPSTVCTLQRLDNGEWLPISTCEVDRSELCIAESTAKQLEGRVKVNRRKLRHRKVTAELCADGLKVSKELERVAKHGLELTDDYCKRLTEAITSLLDGVSTNA